MYHVYPASYEDLEERLNSLSSDEELFSVTPAGSQAIIITKDKKGTNSAEDVLRARQRLFEQMNLSTDRASLSTCRNDN